MNAVDASTMRQIDLKAQEDFGIPEILLMESAGRETADVILDFLKDRPGKIAFFCGKGNNGGDGFVAARHLWLKGFPVIIFLVGEKNQLKDSARLNFEILLRMDCPIYEIREEQELSKEILKMAPFLLAVDALLGIGLKGEVREPYRNAIEQMNRLSCPKVSVDIPSGLCADTGRILGVCIQAKLTVTFGFLKQGLLRGEGPRVAGRVIVTPISLPTQLLQP